MSKLISNHVLRATESNMLKNDCPLNCNKQYCTDCQFREKSSKVTQNKRLSLLLRQRYMVEICIINPKQVNMVKSTLRTTNQPEP